MRNLCVKIENGVVVDAIICKNIDWANEKLGGEWIAVPDDVACGIGYEYMDGEFVAPQGEEDNVDTDTD
jgi:hypothetical protein